MKISALRQACSTISRTAALLILDNHHRHVNLDVINYAKDNHVTLLSFPPHCSHELQPLDKSVYGPFKTSVHQASDSWMRDPQNAGKSMSIHIIPHLTGYAFPKAFSTDNIVSGFSTTGIWPFDRNVFPTDKFLPSSIRDRPLMPDGGSDGRDSPSAPALSLCPSTSQAGYFF